VCDSGTTVPQSDARVWPEQNWSPFDEAFGGIPSARVSPWGSLLRHTILAISICAVLGSSVDVEPAQRTLSFQGRVDAQAAIERVYYAHQLGATKPFEQAVPTSVLEDKVRKYIDQTDALSVYWKTAVTDAMLQRELERMAADSMMPERLVEMYAALGNDPVLVKECLARPALVDRLTQNFFAFDTTLHAPERAQAEELRTQLVSGSVAPTTARADRWERVITLEDANSATPETPHDESRRIGGAELSRIRLTADEFRARRQSLPAIVGKVSDVKEDRDAFVVSIVLSETPRELRVASYVVPKVSWDRWWAKARLGLEPAPLTVSTASRAPLPVPRQHRPDASRGSGVSMSSSCAAIDSWQGMQHDMPNGTVEHTAIWTGSLMVVWGGYRNPNTPAGLRWFNTGGRYDPATDTWTPTSMTGAPTPRSGHSAVWTGNTMIVWGGIAGFATVANTGGRYDPSSDTWTPTSTTSAPSARGRHTAVWTGSSMIVWGGTIYDSTGQTFNTGGRYDPSTDTWTPISTSNAPSARDSHTAVWTGSVMVVWGGHFYANQSDGYVRTGGRYNPTTDTWTPTSITDAPGARSHHSFIWTGSSIVVWGGRASGSPLGNGGRYNPVTDIWTLVSTSGAPSPRTSHAAVWTGSSMIVWGGDNSTPVFPVAGGRYNPVTDTWSAASTTGTPTGRSQHTAVWTGSLMLVWGGSSPTGGRYDPVNDSWTPMRPTGGPWASKYHSTVWTGSLMVVWGGYNESANAPFNTGGRYDPAIDNWTPTSVGSQFNDPRPRVYHTAVWTGMEMLVWSGYDGNNHSSSGDRYNPLTDSWTSMSTFNAPSLRSGYTALWTGSRMLIWGAGTYPFGWIPEDFVDTGGLYDPASDTWTATSSTNAPSPRGGYSAVWTGNSMLIWSGIDGSDVLLDTGSRYDPLTDSWTPISKSDAPSPRLYQSAVWTGNEMVVWAGIYRDATNHYLNSGGRYDPTTDHWASTSIVGAPTARWDHSAVWTGNQMVVWGGAAGAVRFDTGARYDPATDSWAPTSTTGAPSPRQHQAAVWTGSSMLVWGGDQAQNNGGRYDPGAAADSDGDSVDDTCDDCPSEYDPAQSDSDHDGVGDVCDLDDGLIYVYATDENHVEWKPEIGFSSWNVYEGDLAVLRATGAYTQAPGSNPLAVRACGAVSPWTDSGIPLSPGMVKFALITGVSAGVEGGLGTNSAGLPRPNTNPCP
jgi:N-acetylneuraminic acid mutarotase